MENGRQRFHRSGEAGAGAHHVSTATGTELMNLINITVSQRIRGRVSSPWGHRNPEIEALQRHRKLTVKPMETAETPAWPPCCLTQTPTSFPEMSCFLLKNTLGL